MIDVLTQATTEVENNPVLNITIFAAFVAVTLFAPKGLGGLFDLMSRRATRQGDWGPDDGAWRKEEGEP